LLPSLVLQFERLAAAEIQLLPVPEVTTHFVFEREGCVVLVERRGEGFGSIGSPGLLTAGGFAALVTRDASIAIYATFWVKPALATRR